MSEVMEMNQVAPEKSLLDCFVEAINTLLRTSDKHMTEVGEYRIDIPQQKLFGIVERRTKISFDAWSYREKLVPELKRLYESVGWEVGAWTDKSSVCICSEGTELQFYGKMPKNKVEPVKMEA